MKIANHETMRRTFILILLLVATRIGGVLHVRAAGNDSVKVGVLLPLKESTDRGRTFIEFYRGLLMAVEDAKGEGIHVEVTAMDCGTTEAQMAQVLPHAALADLDVIFGPADSAQVTLLSEHCRRHGIRMVLPFNTPCPQVYSNPWIYQVGVAQELLYPGISNLLLENMPNSNFVFYRSGQEDPRGQAFTSHLTQVLRLRGMQMTELPAACDERACDLALNQFRENVVIPDSRSREALTALVNGLKDYHGKYPQYKIRLLGYPEWLTYARTMLQDFYQFDTHVFSAYYRNPLGGRVAKFEQRYQQNFSRRSRESYPKAEMLGYDLGNYFLQGLARLGHDFDPAQHQPPLQPVQHTFHFQRVGEAGGFVNLHVQLVRYTTNNTIQVVK